MKKSILHKMSQTEENILQSAQGLFEQKNYAKLRNFIWSNHMECESDSTKLKLLHFWESSLYREFIDARRRNLGGVTADVMDDKAILSSSMRYKLRKKHPCPVELENELRVKNARLPKKVHDGLNMWLKKHQENPYPNKVEKEGLASKLGITPQQVNRWFIQRRKMLRIRGQLYLGRGFTDNYSGSDDEDEYEEENESKPQPKMNDRIKSECDEDQHPPSLLEKILTSSMLEYQGSNANREKYQSPMGLLTPPPSISGGDSPEVGSFHRLTPAHSGRYTPDDMWEAQQKEALDLSKHQHECDASSEASSGGAELSIFFKNEEDFHRKGIKMEEDGDEGVGIGENDEKMMAVNALLALSKGALV